MNSIAEAENAIIEEFELFDDWMDKYNYIIELGKSLPLIDPQYKDDAHLIPGCQSQVWLHAEMSDGKLFFRADSDAIITKGIISLLISVYSGESPAEIAADDFAFVADLGHIDQIGIKEHLSPTRSNGLLSMIQQIRGYAKGNL